MPIWHKYMDNIQWHFKCLSKSSHFLMWHDTEHATLTKNNAAQSFRNKIEQNNLSLLLVRRRLNLLQRNAIGRLLGYSKWEWKVPRMLSGCYVGIAGAEPSGRGGVEAGPQTETFSHQLVGWSLTFLFSTNTAMSETIQSPVCGHP